MDTEESLPVEKTLKMALGISAVMTGNVQGRLLPVSIHPACFALGSVLEKPGVVKDEIKIREFLEMTILIDHNVIDGAPAARFISRLSDLVEKESNI